MRGSAMVVRGWARHAAIDWGAVVAPHAVRAPIRNVRELLYEESLGDGNTQERFGAWARGDCRDVRFEADTRIAAEMRGGFVPDYSGLDLYMIQGEAEDAEGDNPRRAEAVYMGLTESLGVHYNVIDDSGGAFWPLFGECVEAMGRCTRRQDRRPRSEAKTCMRSLPRFRPDAVSCAPIHAQNRFPSAGSVASHFLKWPWVLLQRSVDVQSVRWWSNGMMGDCHSSDRGSIPRRRT